MGIPVTCPFGHKFKVKDKYAGKKGLCPFCKDQVAVRVPDAASSENLKSAAYRAAAEEHGPSAAAAAAAAASVFDDHDETTDSSTSASLLSSSVIRHNIRCQCGEKVPMWFARCPKCGIYLEH